MNILGQNVCSFHPLIEDTEDLPLVHLHFAKTRGGNRQKHMLLGSFLVPPTNPMS